MKIKGAKKEPKRSQKKGADHKQEILTLLEKNPSMTQVQLMEALGLSRKQVQTLIKELQEKHLLVREGSNRKGRWIVQKVV